MSTSKLEHVGKELSRYSNDESRSEPGLYDNDEVSSDSAEADSAVSIANTSKALSEVTPIQQATWAALPRKDQLFILAFARLAEPVFQTSIDSYLFFMLQSFNQKQSSAGISSQAGFLTAGFTATQFFTAVFWGAVAGKASVGRKNVLIIGLLGTITAAVGFGFSRSFAWAMFFRCLGGALNGNVSVLRTMTSEVIREKKYQTKAFVLMPMMCNFGVLVGPLIGGWLQDPYHTFPHAFGPGSRFGGKSGVGWMLKYPYAFPNIVCALLLTLCLLLVVFGLEETHVDRRASYDLGLKIGKAITRVVLCRPRKPKYVRIDDANAQQLDQAWSETTTQIEKVTKPRPKLPLRQLIRRNILLTFLVHGLLACHVGGFVNLLFLFLSSPRFSPDQGDSSSRSQPSPFLFTGGLGFSPASVGAAISMTGLLGLLLQLGVYSWVTSKVGVLYSFRFALALFPVAYGLAPYLVLLPTKSEPPKAADGTWVWAGIALLLLVVVTGRIFAQPCALILVNNCTPHPSALSTVHGIAQSVSAGSRTVGPLIYSFLYGQGLKNGMVGLAWWVLSVQALVAFGASWLVYEGTGHDIRLDGDQVRER